MLSRLTNTKYWIKVLAASISTSLIIFISFMIRNFIKKQKENKKTRRDYIKFTPIDFLLSFCFYLLLYLIQLCI